MGSSCQDRAVASIVGSQLPRTAVKEINPLEMVVRVVGRVAAVSGVVGLLVWLTWVMLDVKNMQSGFTLPN